MDAAWLASCGGRKGTYAGSVWHHKFKIPACADCKRAQAQYMREYRRARSGGLHHHMLPEWLVKQLIAEASPELQRTANLMVACCLCASGECASTPTGDVPMEDDGGEGYSEGDAGPGEGPGGSAL